MAAAQDASFWTLTAVLCLTGLLFAVYCIMGSIVRYRGGIRTCPHMMPHYRTWRHLGESVCCCCSNSDGGASGDLAGAGDDGAKRRASIDEDRIAFTRVAVDEDDIDLDDDDFNLPAPIATGPPPPPSIVTAGSA